MVSKKNFDYIKQRCKRRSKRDNRSKKIRYSLKKVWKQLNNGETKCINSLIRDRNNHTIRHNHVMKSMEYRFKYISG